MKVEMIKSNTLTNGIKDISDKYGPTALILRNIETDGQEVLFIAHEHCEDDSSTELQGKPPILKKPESLKTPPKASKEEIELVRQAIKSLPDSFNLSEKNADDRSPLSVMDNSIGHHNLASFNQETNLEKNLHQLLDETPVSSNIRNLLSSYVDKPESKKELLYQIESGMIKNLPESGEIRLDSQIHVLTGSHGSGKTSIALKIAAQLRDACDHNVSIVSFGEKADASKLETLSKQLNLPVFSVKDPNQLAQLLDLEGDNDIYIIDLELDSAAMAIPLIRRAYEKAQFHLVTPTDISLPSLWASCDLDKWDSIILTRLDSPLVPWAAVEALSKFKIPLSIGSASSDIKSGLVKITNKSISCRLTEYINDHIDEFNNQPGKKKSSKIRALH